MGVLVAICRQHLPGTRHRIAAWLAFLLVASAQAGQGERFESLGDYHLSLGAGGGNKADIRMDATDVKAPQGPLIAGLVHVAPEPETEDPQAVVFVVQQLASGEVIEVERSRPFDFGDGGMRTYVEIVSAEGESRFSIQVNHRGNCTSGFDIFRFSYRDHSWVVSGVDSTIFQCSEKDESYSDTRTEHSANLLTGKVVDKSYVQNKLKRKSTAVSKFPRFLLRDFDPFNSVYSPR